MAFKASATYGQAAVLLLLVGLWTFHSEAARLPPPNNVVCDFQNNLATSSVCDTLVNSLKGNNTVVPSGQQSICKSTPFLVMGAHQVCCVSWSNPAPGVTMNDLYNSADTVLAQCQKNGKVSGEQSQVNLNGAIVTQCLSNRSTGC